MSKNINKPLQRSLNAIIGGAMLSAMPALAGAKIDVAEDAFINLGLGMRFEFSSVEDAAPSGDEDSFDFDVPSVRLYTSGQFMKNLGFTLNTEYKTDGGDKEMEVMDAILQYTCSDLFHVWTGRFLPPSDRSNLSGPYYLNAWDYPTTVAVNNIAPIIAGRDEGIAVWGQTDGGKFKYQVGLFEGAATPDDDPLFAGKVVLNLWDPEPGYYNSSTYYGDKDILALGITYQMQPNATVSTDGDFAGLYIDILAEKNLGDMGVPTFELGYYDYDYDDQIDEAGLQGDGYFVLLSYLLPNQTGVGKWQPMLRIQDFETESGVDSDRLDLGANYIIKSHNMRLSIVFAQSEVAKVEQDVIKVGMQVQL